ncbi:hypothetical protein DFJ74DRAFT_422058 [Hyaloraphidium curvatum]|nr:hypothetical protein DFJ74DRAFT_422058 [Hyaloraphidium curvatum]
MGASGGQGAPAPTPRPVTLHLPMPLPMPPNALVLPGAADIPLLAQAAAARQDPEPHEVNGHPPPAVPEPPAPRGPVPPQPGPQPPKPRQPKRRRDRQPAPDRRVAVPPLAFPERADNEAGLRNLMVFYEAARKQIQAWGPEATWRIDLVLDPPAPSRAPTPPPEPLYHTLPGPPAPVPIPIPLGPTELLPPVDFPAPPTDPTLAHRIHLEAMPRALALESRPGARADPEMLGFAEWAVPWGEIVLPAAAEGRRGGVRGEEMLAYAQGEVRRLEAEVRCFVAAVCGESGC